MDASARESLAEHCERRAREIRAAVEETLEQNTSPRADDALALLAMASSERGAAKALEEMAIWARTPPSERVVDVDPHAPWCASRDANFAEIVGGPREDSIHIVDGRVIKREQGL